jgi:hypothetical protein
MKSKLFIYALALLCIRVNAQPQDDFIMRIKFDNITPLGADGILPQNRSYRGVEQYNFFNPAFFLHGDIRIFGKHPCLTTGYLFSGSLIKLRPSAYSVLTLGIRSGDVSIGALAGISRRSTNKGDPNPFGASYLNDKVVGLYFYSKEESFFSINSVFLFEQRNQFIFWKTEVKGAMPPYEVISFFETFVGAGFGAGYRMKNHSVSLVWSLVPHRVEGTGTPFKTIKFTFNSFLM